MKENNFKLSFLEKLYYSHCSINNVIKKVSYLIWYSEDDKNMEYIKKILELRPELLENDNSLLYEAIFSKNESLAILFIDLGTKIDVIDKNQDFYPIEEAISYKLESLSKYIISKGFDINYTNNSGISLLMQAVDFNCYELSKYLIEKGASINQTTKDNNRTLLMISIDNFYFSDTNDLSKYLIDKKCNLNATDDEGNNAYDHCILNNNFKLAEYLLDSEMTLTFKGIDQYYDSLSLTITRGKFDLVKKICNISKYTEEIRKSIKKYIIISFEHGYLEIANYLYQNFVNCEDIEITGDEILQDSFNIKKMHIDKISFPKDGNIQIQLKL